MLVIAGSQGAGVGVQAGVVGQQRRVDVEDRPGGVVDHFGIDDAHVAGEHHQVGPARDDVVEQGAVHGGAVGVVAPVQGHGGDAGGLRPR